MGCSFFKFSLTVTHVLTLPTPSVENCHFDSQFCLFLFLTESCLFVVYSFHSPQELLEFCGLMQLSAVSFLSCPVSSGLLYFSREFFSLYLFILEGSDSLEVIAIAFPVCALCSAEDVPKIIMFIVPDRGQRGWRQ